LKLRDYKRVLILVDASIVITLHKISRWTPFIQRHEVIIPGVVVSDEAIFVDTGEVRRSNIVDSVAQALSSNTVRRCDASSSELAEVEQVLDDLVLTNIHSGEHEGLALMFTPALEEYVWCCSDKLAYKAAGMLGLSDRCVCLDEALRAIGQGYTLPHEYCQEFMDQYVNEGVQCRITGLGMREELH
jgi:hypothetical protein